MTERNRCPKCGRKLEPSDVDGYRFACFECDENFYSFEAVDLMDLRESAFRRHGTMGVPTATSTTKEEA